MNLNKAVLKKKTFVTRDVVELCFEVFGPANGAEFLHKAGQFVSVKVDKIFRSYSISSRPQKNYFELCVKVVENGLASNYLANLEEGNEIEFLGPIGNFTFQKQNESQPQKTTIFIGTGTGIAPLKSIIEDELEKGWSGKIYLMYCVRYIKDIFYKEFFEKLAAKHKNFTFDITLSRPEDPSWEKSGGKTGRVTDLLRNMQLDPSATETYTCGLKEMVEETTSILQQKGLLSEAIHFERFN